MPKIVLLLVVLAMFSCNVDRSTPIKEGVWRAELQVTETETLPFNFEVTSKKSLKIFNAEEVIVVDDISYQNDSVIIKMPVFEGYILAALTENEMSGNFINESLGRSVPFKANWNQKTRFNNEKKPTDYDVSGSWETVFSKDVEGDEYLAKGVFQQVGDKVTGTFRTNTGDYRFLEGNVEGDQLHLSTFDGSHAFLFTATLTDSTMEGTFYSGNHWKEPFVAVRNSDFELADENNMTFLKEGYEKLEFSFPDSNSKMVSLNDDRFRNKVVVVQIMGSWCPNCLDESKYYSEYNKNNKDKDVKFVALAFEYAKTEKLAFKSIERLKNDVGIDYPVLLAQFGSSSKSKAGDKLPMLTNILSYPTTIIIDKKGKVRKIHTGFNGPATGEKYDDFKSEFEGFIAELLKEG